MPRVRVELPDEWPFSTEIDIGVGMINYGGHLGNDSFFTLLHEARLRYLKSLGYTELDVEGLGLIVVDAAIEYKAECRHGELLRVAVAPADPRPRGCDLCYLVTKADGTVAARAKTGVLFFDYGTRHVAAMPASFANKTGLSVKWAT